MQNEIEILINAINQDYINWWGEKIKQPHVQEMVKEFQKSVRIDEGSKYLKIVAQGSVWGFIVKSEKDKLFRKGDILKAAGFNAPARNKARGNILDGGYKIRWTGPYYL